MALLKQSALLLLAALTLAASGCTQTAALGHAELWLRECADCAVSGELHRVDAYFDTQGSRYAPRGFYAYLELERTDGARGILELDVPIDGAGAPIGPEQVSYRETLNGRLLFDAQQVQGTLQLPAALVHPEVDSCGCDDALFQLQFRAGDAVRELRYGHLSRQGQSCGALPPSTDSAGMNVVVKECEVVVEPPSAAPSPRTSTSTTISTSSVRPASSTRSCDRGDCHDDGSYNAVEVGCGSSSTDTSGCGGSERRYDDSSTGSSGGCAEDNGSSSSSSSSSSGCSDSSSDDKHKGGCEGDTSDSPSSCSVVRRPASGLRSFMGTGLPLLLVCLWQAVRARRLRRQSRQA